MNAKSINGAVPWTWQAFGGVPHSGHIHVYVDIVRQHDALDGGSWVRKAADKDWSGELPEFPYYEQKDKIRSLLTNAQ